MMIMLSKRDYDDLLKRCSNADILADEKFNDLKERLRKELEKWVRNPNDPGQWGPGVRKLLELLN